MGNAGVRLLLQLLGGLLRLSFEGGVVLSHLLLLLLLQGRLKVTRIRIGHRTAGY